MSVRYHPKPHGSHLSTSLYPPPAIPSHLIHILVPEPKLQFAPTHPTKQKRVLFLERGGGINIDFALFTQANKRVQEGVGEREREREREPNTGQGLP